MLSDRENRRNPRTACDGCRRAKRGCKRTLPIENADDGYISVDDDEPIGCCDNDSESHVAGSANETRSAEPSHPTFNSQQANEILASIKGWRSNVIQEAMEIMTAIDYTANLVEGLEEALENAFRKASK